jgi:hypothetical protein
MRLHDITPRTTSFATSHLAKETTGHNIMLERVTVILVCMDLQKEKNLKC